MRATEGADLGLVHASPSAERGAIRGANWSCLVCLQPSRGIDGASKVASQGQSRRGQGFS